MKKNNRIRNLAISTVVISLLTSVSIGVLSRNNKNFSMKINTKKELSYDDLKITEAIFYKNGEIVFNTNMSEIENNSDNERFVEENVDLIDHVEIYDSLKNESIVLTPEEYKKRQTNENSKTKSLKR